MRAPSLRAAASAAVLALAAGCSSGTPGEISSSASRVLASQVQHVREVASFGTFAELKAAVANLKETVRQQERDGGLSASRATAIEDAADVLLTDAKAERTPSPTPTTESPTPIPTTESPTPTPTETTESPTPTPTETTSSPIISTSFGDKSKSPKAEAQPSQSSAP